MSVGFKSPLPILGLSSVPDTTTVGRGNGPHPLLIGSRGVTGETVGRGNGPHPLLLGSTGVVTTIIGRGNGPHPLLLGVGDYVEPPVVEEPVRDAYSSMVYGIRPSDKREDIERIIQDDEELVEIIIMLAESGVLD